MQDRVWDNNIGWVHTEKGIRAVLKTDEVTIKQLTDEYQLLCLHKSDGSIVYPYFQFDDKMRVITGLADVWEILCGSVFDDWAIVAWLLAPNQVLRHKSPVNYIKAQLDLQVLIELAKQTSVRWGKFI